MKKLWFSMTKTLFVVFVSCLVLSCKSNSSSEKINIDSTINKVNNSSSDANQLYSEGMKILNDRISIQSSDTAKAMDLNKKVIEKFSNAYKADTSLIEPVLFASECTMYAKDYYNCAYWTSILKRLDTSLRNATFCNERLEFCNKQLKLEQKK